MESASSEVSLDVFRVRVDRRRVDRDRFHSFFVGSRPFWNKDVPLVCGDLIELEFTSESFLRMMEMGMPRLMRDPPVRMQNIAVQIGPVCVDSSVQVAPILDDRSTQANWMSVDAVSQTCAGEMVDASTLVTNSCTNLVHRFLTQEEACQTTDSDFALTTRKRAAGDSFGLKMGCDVGKMPRFDDYGFLYHNHAAIINLSDVIVPEMVSLFLSLGKKFNPPIRLNVEHVMNDLSRILSGQSFASSLNFLIPQVVRVISEEKARRYDHHHSYVAELISSTKEFLERNPELRVGTADKGGVTVIFSQDFYRGKVFEHLSDGGVYCSMLFSSHFSFVRKNAAFLGRLAELQVIPKNHADQAISRETQTTKFYGLFKIHKEDFPIRPIQSKVDTPGNRLTQILTKTFDRIAADDPYELRDSFQLCDELQCLILKPEDRLYTLDVVSMFTSIPPDFALEIILRHDISSSKIHKELFIEIYNFLFKHCTEFQFDGRTYKQIEGLPMGSSASPVIAKIVTRDFFDRVVSRFPDLTFFRKYIDDLCLITTPIRAQQVTDLLNSFHPKIEFVLKEEEVASVDYLDVTLIRMGQKVLTKWFSKPYASQRFLNFYSAHPPYVVFNTGLQYIRRMLRLSDPTFHEEMYERAKEILHKNSFPAQVADRIVSIAQGAMGVGKVPRPGRSYDSVQVPLDVFSRLNSLFGQVDASFSLALKTSSTNAGACFYTNMKDKEIFENLSNVVVLFMCKSCSFKYVFPISTPVILFKIMNYDHTFHPAFKMQNHVRIHGDAAAIPYVRRVLYYCSNKEEMMGLAKSYCLTHRLEVPAVAQNSLVARFVEKLMKERPVDGK